ncbi:4126_t:CDS:2 [Dentiscutata heterogama]|uniref:4126_t:CDS:1 n=1 Tax=Dentiscutata heterogama TaxID=1316150 RepID=A0ACA9LPP1_9GLOM|nr:4126_t:CDS:2 [Dentiscutata heterogama]
MRHQVSNLYPSPQEFLESVHELVDLPQKVMNSPPNSFQELIDSPQETLCDETCDEMRDEMRDEMCDETYNGTYDEVHDETYDGVHDETHDEVHETHKGQDLVGINSALPHINKAIVFAIDNTFPNWSIAEHYVAEYGRQKGFVPIKIRNKTDRNGRLINLYYKCEFSGTYQLKKTNNLQNQHNKGSKKLNCDWKANLSFATGVVRITSFNDNHVEHQLSLDTKIFAPVNHRFSDDCREEIRHLTVNEHNVEGSEASQLLKQLYEYREKDPNWYIEPLVDSISNRLRGIFWMDPGQRERWIRFCDIIALMSDETIESFRWVMGQLKKATGILPRILMMDEDLSMKYVVAHDLPNTKHLFCLYHLSQNLLKNLRCKLGMQYTDFIKDFYLACNSLSESTVFPQVVQQINKYLTPNLATEQQKQIVQSTIYRAQILNSWNSDLLNLQDVTYDDDFIENTYDVSQSYLLALIKENEYSSVKEVWRITCLISTKFHIMLLPIRWCKDDITESERAQELFLTSNRNTELAMITHQLCNATNVNLLRIDDVQENSFQKSVDKKLQFNKSMSLAKKAITLQNSENDNELDTLLKNYIEKKTLQREKETKEREMRILRDYHSSENVLAIKTDDNQLISIDNVANPLNHIGKGAPKKNRIKGAQEDHTSKKKAKSGASTRLCGLCHEPNHYKSTCPQKKSNLEK